MTSNVIPPNQLISQLLSDLRLGKLDLPAMPQVMQKMNDIMSQSGASVRDVARIAATDAFLGGRLVQLANSPLFSTGKTIDSVQKAIACLGMEKVKNLVAGIMAKQLFQTANNNMQRRLQNLWAHSTQVAAISTLLAGRFTRISPDEAMLAGLLHDIGELPVLRYVEKLQVSGDVDHWLPKINAKVAPVIGKTILQAWKFPSAIVTAVAEHENVLHETAEIDLTDVVILADLHSRIGTNHPLAKSSWENIPAIRKSGLEPEQSIAMIKKSRGEILQLQQILSA